MLARWTMGIRMSWGWAMGIEISACSNMGNGMSAHSDMRFECWLVRTRELGWSRVGPWEFVTSTGSNVEIGTMGMWTSTLLKEESLVREAAGSRVRYLRALQIYRERES